MGKKNFDTVGNTTSLKKTLAEFGIGEKEEEEIEVVEEEPKVTKKIKYTKDKTHFVGMRISPKEWEDLKKIARIDGTTISAIISKLIQKEINKRADDIVNLDKMAK